MRLSVGEEGSSLVLLFRARNDRRVESKLTRILLFFTATAYLRPLPTLATTALLARSAVTTGSQTSSPALPTPSSEWIRSVFVSVASSHLTHSSPSYHLLLSSGLIPDPTARPRSSSGGPRPTEEGSAARLETLRATSLPLALLALAPDGSGIPEGSEYCLVIH